MQDGKNSIMCLPIENSPKLCNSLIWHRKNKSLPGSQLWTIWPREKCRNGKYKKWLTLAKSHLKSIFNSFCNLHNLIILIYPFQNYANGLIPNNKFMVILIWWKILLLTKLYIFYSLEFFTPKLLSTNTYRRSLGCWGSTKQSALQLLNNYLASIWMMALSLKGFRHLAVLRQPAQSKRKSLFAGWLRT